jgi:hypothetical protein
MIWQDAVITAASASFVISLIPQVYHGFKDKVGVIKLQTSIPTVLGLLAMVFALWTLNLHFSASITALTSAMWITLLIQRLIYKA